MRVQANFEGISLVFETCFGDDCIRLPTGGGRKWPRRYRNLSLVFNLSTIKCCVVPQFPNEREAAIRCADLIRGLLALYSDNHDARLYDFAVKLAGLITKHAQTSPNVYLRGWDGRAIPSTPYGSLGSDAGSIGVFADLATVKPPSHAAMRAADGAGSGRVPRGPA